MPELLLKELLTNTDEVLTKGEIFSLIYHDVFAYPLTPEDLIKWTTGKSIQYPVSSIQYQYKQGFYFIKGSKTSIYKRILKEKISTKKMALALKAAKILSFIPSVKMVAVTGSLAMGNASDESDIDLMIITKNGALWVTRLVSYLVISLVGIKTRKPGDKEQKDKLCLNLWLDEGALLWPKKDRNIFTAHEIAQIVPLVNKNKTYEKFIWRNKWIKEYWPNAVRVTKVQRYKGTKSGLLHPVTLFLCNLITFSVEKLAFKLQYFYMKLKVTREIVTPSRALFHPNDWGKVILSRFNF